MSNDLIIRISAQSDEFKDSLDSISKQTEGLEDTLASVAKISAVAFAALSAEVFTSVKAFGEQQRAMAEVNLALQNQGIYTTELAANYRAVAEAIEGKTGVDAEAITSGQALLQGLIGQTQITDNLTKAVVDLAAAKKIDLASAFELVGKGINGNIVGLQKLGITIDEQGSKSEKLGQITDILNQKFGGQAEAATAGVGSFKLLEAAVSNLQKEIGERLAPTVESSIRTVTNFINTLKENKPLLDFVTYVGGAGLALTALGVAVGVAGQALLALRAGLLAVGLTTQVVTVGIQAMVGATGLGLLALVVTELYLNWGTIWPKMSAYFKAFADYVTNAAAGLGKVLLGALTLDNTKIQAGLDQLKATYKNAFTEVAAIQNSATENEQKQDTAKAKLAAAAEAREAATRSRKIAAEKAAQNVIKLQAENASKETIDLAKQEADILKAIEDDKNKAIRDNLYARLEIVREMQKQNRDDEQAQEEEYRALQLEQTQEFQDLSTEQRAIYHAQYQQELQSQILTENQLRTKAANDRIALQIKEQNTFVTNQKKFGTVYAEMQKVFNNESVQGFKNATNELVELQGSSNKTLYTIGKTAAIAQIGIKTAQSAMDVYAGFCTIPIIGPILGVAAAAAVIAFGAEKISKVNATQPPTGAFDGGVIEGGIKGMDSVPAFLAPGELVTPTRNYDEVVNAVADQRIRKQQLEGQGAQTPAGQITVELSLKDDLMNFVEVKILERQRLKISALGTV